MELNLSYAYRSASLLNVKMSYIAVIKCTYKKKASKRTHNNSAHREHTAQINRSEAQKTHRQNQIYWFLCCQMSRLSINHCTSYILYMSLLEQFEITRRREKDNIK